MCKRLTPWLMAFGLATALVFATRHMSATPPEAAEGKEAAPAAPTPGVKLAASRVAAVTVYPNSALVTREVDVPEGTGTLELTVNPLPPTTVNSSLYTEGSDGVRVLTTRFRTRPILEDTREEVRKLQDELKQLQTSREKVEAEIKAIQENDKTVTKMEGFMSVTTMQSAEKGALNSDSAIALSKHIRETRLETARELVG